MDEGEGEAFINSFIFFFILALDSSMADFVYLKASCRVWNMVGFQ